VCLENQASTVRSNAIFAVERTAASSSTSALLRASTAHACVRAPRTCVRAPLTCVRARTPDKDAVLFCGRTHLRCGRTHLRKNYHILAAVRTNVLPCARAHLCFLHQQTRRQYVLFLNSFNFNRLLDLC
jgi:hypothetical protein